MHGFLARNGKLIAVAVVCLSAGTMTPSVASRLDFADDSDKVDGRHAVGAATERADRRGKLVATSPRTGRLPNDIIKRAPNSRRLGGKPASSYLSDVITVMGDAANIAGTSGLEAYGSASVACPRHHPLLLSGSYMQADGDPSVIVYRTWMSGRTFTADGKNVSGMVGRSFTAYAVCAR